MLKGHCGKSALDLQVLHLGGERRLGEWSWRAGAVVPLRIDSSAGGRIKPPFPLPPTLGLGWQSDGLSIDLALYAHAVMSIHRGSPAPSADLGVTLAY